MTDPRRVTGYLSASFHSSVMPRLPSVVLCASPLCDPAALWSWDTPIPVPFLVGFPVFFLISHRVLCILCASLHACGTGQLMTWGML